MGFFDNIRKAFGYTSDTATTPTDYQLKAGRPSHDKRVSSKQPLMTQVRRRKYRIDATMKHWRNAVNMAQDQINPRRELLHQVYDTCMEDIVLLREIRTARFTVQMGDYNIYRNAVNDDDLKSLFDKPWFFKLIQHYVDTEMYGHSLIEFRFKDGKVDQVLLFPRDCVRPEKGEIILDYSSYDGIPYRNEMMKRFNLMEIGEHDDLGILYPASNYVIRKMYNITDWGKNNESYGKPFIIGKTSSRNKDEINKKVDMLQNFGSAQWGLFDDQDSVEFLESKGASSGNGHRTFAQMNEYLDRAVAQLINGQSATSEEKAYVGSAEIQERILNKYTLARMKRIQYHINEELIPFLINRGYPLIGCEFRFVDLEAKEDETTMDLTDNDNDSVKNRKKKVLTEEEE